MANNLNGTFDGGAGDVYRLVIDQYSEPTGTFSGYFHDARTNKWEKLTGSFSFYRDGRDETVLWFKASGSSWRWGADFKNGAPSFDKWMAKRTSNTNVNDVETIDFYKESETPRTPTIDELRYEQ